MGSFSRNVGFVRNIESDGAVLGRLLARLGLSVSFLSPLLAHAKAVQRDSLRLGLVSYSDIDQIVLRHSADALLFALVRRPATGEQWVDVGSGAGFLELQAADLGAVNVVVDHRRHEEIPDDTFDVAVARALAEPEVALTSMIKLVRIGGEALVAVGASGSVPGGTAVRLEGVGFVDSPGVFSMMTRKR